MSPFHLVDARSAAEAVALLQTHGPSAQPIAAGGDLLGLWKDGVTGPSWPPPRVVVNLATAAELRWIERHQDQWSLGAMASLATLAGTAGLPMMLGEAIGRIASPQLRSLTTLGGNLLQRPRCLYFRHPDEACFKKGGTGCPAIGGPVQAYPGALIPGQCHAGHPSDLAPVLIALQATAELLGPSGLRHAPLADLYRDADARAESEAAVGHDEVLVRLLVPHTTMAQAFEKVAPRDANEFATASAAAVGVVHQDHWGALRVAVAGVAPGPLVLATDEVIGRHAGAQTFAAQAAALLPAPQRIPLNTRLSDARLAVERVLTRIGSGA